MKLSGGGRQYSQAATNRSISGVVSFHSEEWHCSCIDLASDAVGRPTRSVTVSETYNASSS
jgi:hypothetical protein